MQWEDMEASSVHFAWPNKGGLGDQLLRKAFAETDVNEAFKYMDVYNKWVYEESPVIHVLWLEEEEPMSADIKGYIPRLTLRNTAWVTQDGKSEEDDTTLIIAQASDVASVSPMTIGDTHSFSVAYLSYGYLAYMDENFEVEPGLAKSWEMNEDSTELTVHLHDVKWHDGTPFTSEDVKWTWEFVALSEDRPAYAYHFHYTLLREDIESIETPDAHTVVFKYNKPHGMGINELTRIPLMAKHRWEGISRDDIREHPQCTEGPAMGLGPYKMVKWVKGQYIEFEANDDFYLGRPFYDKLFLKFIPERASALAALETGEANWLMHTYALGKELDPIRDNPNFQVHSYTRGRSEGICFNCEHPALTTNVRKAMQHLMPREHIVNNLRGGHGWPANQLCPEWNWGHSPDLPYYDFNLEKAQQYMAEAGLDVALLEPPEPIPTTTYILPAIGGLLVGVVASLVFVRSRE
jgi:peptide/nickel transport system substrate-binding protein